MYNKNYRLDHFREKTSDRVHPGDLFHILNDVMISHAASIGLDQAYHEAHQIMWVLTAYELDLWSMPEGDETILANTRPYAFKKMYGYRWYELVDASMRLFATAKGRFVLIDTHTQRLRVPSKAMLARFKDAKLEPDTRAFVKLAPRPIHPPVYTRMLRVEPHHIDLNGHVNNAVYPDWAWSNLPDNEAAIPLPLKMSVHFKREVFVDETLLLQYHRHQEGWDIVMLKGDTLVARVLIQPQEYHHFSSKGSSL